MRYQILPLARFMIIMKIICVCKRIIKSVNVKKGKSYSYWSVHVHVLVSQFLERVKGRTGGRETSEVAPQLLETFKYKKAIINQLAAQCIIIRTANPQVFQLSQQMISITIAFHPAGCKDIWQPMKKKNAFGGEKQIYVDMYYVILYHVPLIYFLTPRYRHYDSVKRGVI